MWNEADFFPALEEKAAEGKVVAEEGGGDEKGGVAD